MTSPLTFALLASMGATGTIHANTPKLAGIGTAMQEMVDAKEVAGAVTQVITKDEILHLETTGWADIATEKPMQPDTIFRIASMTKPTTAVALLMLQEEEKLDVNDPVSRYIPEFAELKTPSGKPADLTITQLLVHTSGMGEGSREATAEAQTLADLIPAYLAAPMQFEPGERWQYCQSSINTAARIVEIVSGQSFERFLEERLFAPLGMKDTAFYLSPEQAKRMTTAYAKNGDTGTLEVGQRYLDPLNANRPPLGNAGLFSTAPDYSRFCQMLLSGGTVDGTQYLEPASIELLTRNRTGDLAAGFMPGSAWGLATSLVSEPQGKTAMLSPGTFGHGGLHGTQAWIDPVKGVAYILMVQRTNFPNSDASDVRMAFQQAAADALADR